MGYRVINGVKMGHVRRCACGRDPSISTRYEGLGLEPDFGPFVLHCYCGRNPNAPTDADKYGIVLPTLMARSWVKTRAVRIWNNAARELVPATPDPVA